MSLVNWSLRPINLAAKILLVKSKHISLVCLQGAHLLAPEWKNNCSQYRVLTKGMKRTISTVMAQSLFQLMHSPKSEREEREREKGRARSRRGRNLCTVEHRSSSSLSRVLFSPSIKRHSICKGEEIRAKRTPGRKERRKRGGGEDEELFALYSRGGLLQ
jgi:hypothetical protein